MAARLCAAAIAPHKSLPSLRGKGDRRRKAVVDEGILS